MYVQSIDTKIDFPFRVTDREHAVINLRSKTPILLLGRSGTGKTTCCLYRLWSRFLAYWSKSHEMNGDRWLPRSVQYAVKETIGEDIGICPHPDASTTSILTVNLFYFFLSFFLFPCSSLVLPALMLIICMVILASEFMASLKKVIQLM